MKRFFVLGFIGAMLLGQPNIAELRSRLEQKLGKEKVEKIFSDSRFCIYEDTRECFARGNRINYLSENFWVWKKERTEECFDFISKYREKLEKAEKSYGIEKEYVVAILKLESALCKDEGKRHVFNSLSSVYALDERRREWAYKEIEALLSSEIDPFIKGSYAGAFGYAQSMPSSFLAYSVDFDDDGKKKPFCIDDAIGFVANFLQKHGFLENKEKAIFSYNHHHGYVKAVMGLVEILKKR